MKRRMSRIETWKLNQKFALVVFLVVLIPTLTLAILLFSNTSRVITADKIQDLEQSLLRLQTNVDKTVDLCNMTAQTFQNSPNLTNFLLSAKRREALTTETLIAFSRDDVAVFERLVNSNPYLYQARVYFDNPDVPEVMPILYHTDRMERLAWASGSWEPDTWQFDYPDTLFPETITKPARHIMSFVTTIEHHEAGTLGVLEVAVRMDETLPGLFGGEDDTHALFIAGDGSLCHSEDDDAFWREHREEVYSLVDSSAREIATAQGTVAGAPAWVTSVPLPRIGGQFLLVSPPGEITSQLASIRNWYIAGTVALLLFLALLVNFIVTLMLRRFYLAFDAIISIREGDLSVRVPDLGNDEVGDLGRQINLMIGRITELMEENVNRELLAKNSELRALQSQINAHFLYNVLESIKMMAEVDEKYEMADAIHSLGDLLRYSMRWTSPEARVSEEVEYTENYLALINLRHDYVVSLDVSLPDGVLSRKIPKMTLQPIVENAIVHGIAPAEKDAVIRLTAEVLPGELVLVVSDAGVGMDESTLSALREKLASGIEPDPKRGIGLKNVHDRIRMMAGPPYGVSVESQPNRFTRVLIHIPYAESEDSADENASNR